MMDESALIRRAAEVEWMASDARNALLKPYILEVARTYRRLAKMERRLRPGAMMVVPTAGERPSLEA
jgi:hypothetical protein